MDEIRYRRKELMARRVASQKAKEAKLARVAEGASIFRVEEEEAKMESIEGLEGREAVEAVEAVEAGGVKGGEVELEVVRCGPNPRVLSCRYRESGEERRCLVKVRSILKWVRGMKFVMAKGGEGTWEYRGKEPRLRGRW
jgi:hypothetical protein